MTGRLLGYARVSTDEQSVHLQTDALVAAGVPPEAVFTDEGVSGAIRERSGLARLLAEARDGDTVVIWRLDRLGRSAVHLATLLEDWRQQGVSVRSLSDGVDTTTSTGRLMAGLLSTLAEYERDTIRERVVAGMRAARARGVLLGRRRRLRPAQIEHARRMRAEGATYAAIAAVVGVDRSTVWRALRPFAGDGTPT